MNHQVVGYRVCDGYQNLFSFMTDMIFFIETHKHSIATKQFREEQHWNVRVRASLQSDEAWQSFSQVNKKGRELSKRTFHSYLAIFT